MHPCKHHEVCGLSDEAGLEESLCILHSKDPEKDKQAFAAALDAHCKKNSGDFTLVVFPEYADFREAMFTDEVHFWGAEFTKGADFSCAKFTGGANFHDAIFTEVAYFFEATFAKEANFGEATFSGGANFSGVTFIEEVDFECAKFTKEAIFSCAMFTKWAMLGGAMFTKRVDFGGATFAGLANFNETTFAENASFSGARFSKKASFFGARFSKGADFEGAIFTESANFTLSSFQGRTVFAARRRGTRTAPIFWRAEVKFRELIIDPPDALRLIEADLRRCQFQDTDLRKVQMIAVTWPKIGSRLGVYDEIATMEIGTERPWARIEQLYRELKQNYEDRRDYERAGDFHYGEKEMRRRNPETPTGARFLLTLYWLLSGYGERYLRPLMWAGILFAVCTFGYVVLGLIPKGAGSRLAITNVQSWLHAAHYSFRVMTLLRPDDFVPVGYSKLVNTTQTILGPIFLSLFALALRQRLKR